MALEVNEINIRMRAKGRDSMPEERTSGGGKGCSDREKEEIVEDCVRRVLTILMSREER